MKRPTIEKLQQQLAALSASLGKSWITDDDINAKIEDVKAEIERQKRLQNG